MAESKKKSHFKPTISDTDYGYNGLIRIFNELEINIDNWVTMKSTQERGGISFMLPNAEGKIYLTWGDLYLVDIRFVHSNEKYKQTVTLGDLNQIITTLEEQRKNHVSLLRDMLKNAFSSEEE